MDCENIKKLIPSYIKHTAFQEEIKKVEEHLCICNACRQYLAKFMDKEEEFKEKIQRPESEAVSNDLVPKKEIPQEEISSESQGKENKLTGKTDPEPISLSEQEELETTSKKTKKTGQEQTKPKKEKKADFFEFFILLIGLAVLVFFIRLLMKG